MNLRKLNLGLVALVLGFGLVLTQSAFTNTDESEYGNFNGVWYNLADPPPPGKEYFCEPSTTVCTQIYSGGAPDQGGTLVRDEQLDGTFQLIDMR